MKQKFISKKWFILLAIVLLLIPLVAHAETSAVTPTSQLTGTFDDVFKTISGILTQLMRAFQKLLWPVMLAIGGLLGNDLLFGAGMEQRLLEVWTQIRNFVNIAFVVILLGVALYNVIGFGKQDNFMLKTALPKIIIALIAVNFSYVAMKVILDVTNVLTVSIFALPTSISEDLKSTEISAQLFDKEGKPILKDGKPTYKVDANLESKICKSMFGTASDFEERTKKIKAADRTKLHCDFVSGTKTLAFTDAGKKFFAQYSPRNASLVMAIQLMNIVEVDKITEASAAGFNLSKLSFTLLFSVVIYLLYAVAYAILFIVLLVRMVVLWVFIALSPVVAVSLAFPDLLSKAGSSNFDFKEKFIKHAIAPIMIAIPMTLGYIMLDALKNVQTGQIRNDFQLGALDINTAGISDLQSMMVAFGAVAVVWVGVFAAAEGTYAAGIVDGIRSKLKQFGGTIVKGVKLLPLIPAGAGAKGRISFTQASQLWKEPMKQLEAKYGGERETGPLTVHQVNKIRTAAEAKSALGREGLEKRDVQKALAKKIADWRKSPDVEKKRLARQVQGRLGTRNWGRFQKGSLRQPAELRGLRELSGRSAATVNRGTGPAGTAPTPQAAAQAADIGAIETYGTTYGLMTPALEGKYKAIQKEKNATKKAKLESGLRKDADFQKIVNIKNNAGGSLEGVNSSAGVAARDASKKNIDTLKAAIKAADKELEGKAKIATPSERKKILQTHLKKAMGAKYTTLPADVKSMVE
ncbi:hypothetical protein ACFL3T_00180 [Patescibacteria group bacterium]